MTVPTELSLEAVRKFMLENGGKVTNHDLVKHFKQFLTNPVNRGKLCLKELFLRLASVKRVYKLFLYFGVIVNVRIVRKLYFI